ncbi:MAG: glycosyltransferase [Actinobacteria bacterium]|nr:glycosyltransferase [Actinomycetota bacterium]
MTTTDQTHNDFTVLESFKEPTSTTNPYIVMLLRSLRNQCNVMTFSWRGALTEHYDVFHVHWPEILLHSDRPTRRTARRGAFGVLLLRLRLKKTPVVRTMHNLAPHEDVRPVDRWLLRRLDALTTSWIRLNGQTPSSPEMDVSTILHGHFRDWFTYPPRMQPEPSRLLFFGLIRPYKGVVELVSAFAETTNPDFTLVIVGRSTSPELSDSIVRATGGDTRITLRLEHIDDDSLAQEIAGASLVVLPYTQLHNSAAAINALSLDRPTLVPRTPTTTELVQEVGPDWVRQYDGPISAEILENELAGSTGLDEYPPDLSARDWDAVASEHLTVFNRAVQSMTRTHRAGAP